LATLFCIDDKDDLNIFNAAAGFKEKGIPGIECSEIPLPPEARRNDKHWENGKSFSDYQTHVMPGNEASQRWMLSGCLHSLEFTQALYLRVTSSNPIINFQF
jgi:hypothetical protein